MIDVRHHRGLELPGLELWLDPADRQQRAFVSHAHSDHIADHQEVITSAGTARLMQARIGGTRREHVLDYGERRAFENFAITLLPAGHIFGSAQSFIENEAGSLLYTGDFKLRPGLSAERTEWRHAETLVMETTYGLPRYCMPPTEEVMASMVAFCREALEDDAVPVLLGYSLGKSQEILCALLAAALTPMLHGAVHRMTEIYRALKPDFPGGYVRYSAGQVAGKVLVCPPSANKSTMITRIKNRRVAVITGWALDPGATYRYQCDAAFPLTDHADYPDLLRYVELVQPKRVLTLHGFAAPFARDLRDRGVEAWALTEANQLELVLPDRAVVRISGAALPRLPLPDPVLSEFHAFAALGQQIAATTSKLKKVALLSAYLRPLSPAQLPIATCYLTGRAFAQTDPRVLQVGWAVIWRALLAVSKVGEQELRAISRKHADAGKTALEVLSGRTDPQPFSIEESRAFFDELQRLRGPIAKAPLLERRLASITALEGSYIVRVLTGDLRIGLKEGLVEESIAAAFEESPADVRDTNMLLGDIGTTALLAAQHRLGETTLEVFRPIKCMLASPEPTAMAIWSRLIEANARAAWAEDKFDGIRAQIHIAEGRVEIFSRDLRRVTEQFSDIAKAARAFPRRAIFDGEIIAKHEGRRLTFFDLQKRLGRKTEDDLFLESSDVPVVFQAFDLLLLDDAPLIRAPLTQRRTALEQLTLPPRFEIATTFAIASAEEIEAGFQAARLRGNEGLIIKDGASLYSPGRRGLAWLKLKKELATLDVVIVGAEYGHGKRSEVLSDYTFAVRDEASGALLNIGKAYSGLTDVEITQLTGELIASTMEQHGRYRVVRPEIVLEIAFDSVQPSTRHASGLALRFPRIKAIRRDKTPAEIDTVTFARSLVGNVFAAPRQSRPA